MSNNGLFSRMLAFTVGVVLTWGYFHFASSKTTPVHTLSIHELEQQRDIMEMDVETAVANQAANFAQAIDSKKMAIASQQQTAEEQPLEQQVQQLKRELLQQQKLVKAYQQQLQAPSDFEQALLDKFTEQSRNEEWAYRTETAMKDFLQIADLGITPELVSAQCKSSVCKFELAAPKDVDDFDHTQWRELNTKLVQEDFWQQFKVSTSKSSDRDFSLLLSTQTE
ncbi:hypothetical protein [Pseudoalteromonas ostreae]|uniref:hypothetical protein n=1 Tax=Pseudoalteromonas ostreae TaxID=2774154 RepID=UPI001B37E282|nr:hypothetical protein [Pseudoalteromonas ostreae]